MNIAILMTCHNRRETTLRCLNTLAVAASEIKSKSDIFLVDDGSTDGTSEAVRKYVNEAANGGGWKLHLIQGDGSLFWAKGMERAWAAAATSGEAYDFYLWLNDDVSLRIDALKILVRDWKNCGHPLGVIVGVCAQDAQYSQSSYSATTSKDVQLLPNGVAPQRAEGWFNGNVVLVPCGVYATVGNIDGAYTHARADYDYAERLKRARLPFFCTSEYVGVCERDSSDQMRDAGLLHRISLLIRPGYYNLKDLFRFKYRYYGFFRAAFSCLHMMVLPFWRVR